MLPFAVQTPLMVFIVFIFHVIVKKKKEERKE